MAHLTSDELEYAIRDHARAIFEILKQVDSAEYFDMTISKSQTGDDYMLHFNNSYWANKARIYYSGFLYEQ
jgi:hypothetical protein